MKFLMAGTDFVPRLRLLRERVCVLVCVGRLAESLDCLAPKYSPKIVRKGAVDRDDTERPRGGAQQRAVGRTSTGRRGALHEHLEAADLRGTSVAASAPISLASAAPTFPPGGLYCSLTRTRVPRSGPNPGNGRIPR